MLSPAVRKAIYQVLVAVGGLLVVYGLVQPEQVEVWLQVVSSLLLALSSGLAAGNVTDNSKDKDA